MLVDFVSFARFIEKLAHLDALPRPCGFKVACFPVKLTGGSAGWTRVVAIFEDLA